MPKCPLGLGRSAQDSGGWFNAGCGCLRELWGLSRRAFSLPSPERRLGSRGGSGCAAEMLLHNRPPSPASPRGGRRGTRGSRGCRGPRGERSATSGGRRAPGAAGEVKVSGCEAPDPHPLLPVPSFPSSPSPSDVWSWQLGGFRIPDPSPPPRGRYIAGADATRPAARHSLREGRSAAATGGAGGGGRCSGGGAGAAAAPGPGRAWAPGGARRPGGSGAAWARRLQPGPGPGGAASARGLCTVGARARAGGAGPGGAGGARRPRAPGTAAPARAEAGRLPQPRGPRACPGGGRYSPGPLRSGAGEPEAALWSPPWDGRLCPPPGQPGRCSLRLPPTVSSPVPLQGGAPLGRRGTRVSGEKTARGGGGGDGRLRWRWRPKGQGGAGCWWWRDDRDLLASRAGPHPPRWEEARLSEDLEKRWGSRSNEEGFSQGHCSEVLGWERAGGRPGPPVGSPWLPNQVT